MRSTNRLEKVKNLHKTNDTLFTLLKERTMEEIRTPCCKLTCHATAKPQVLGLPWTSLTSQLFICCQTIQLSGPRLSQRVSILQRAPLLGSTSSSICSS